jgi:hypothetical protein
MIVVLVFVDVMHDLALFEHTSEDGLGHDPVYVLPSLLRIGVWTAVQIAPLLVARDRAELIRSVLLLAEAAIERCVAERAIHH